MDSSGNLYGTTPTGALGGGGTVFELAQGSGTITTLASFNEPNGASLKPVWSWTAAATCTAQRLVEAPRATARFSSWPRAAARSPRWPRSTAPTVHMPEAGLIMDSSGNLYGTASYGRRLERRHGFRAGPGQRHDHHAGLVQRHQRCTAGGRVDHGQQRQPVRHSVLREAPQRRHGFRAGPGQRHDHHAGLVQRHQRCRPDGRPGHGQQRQPVRHNVR